MTNLSQTHIGNLYSFLEKTQLKRTFLAIPLIQNFPSTTLMLHAFLMNSLVSDTTSHCH